jgi:hypothetical protein
MATVRGFVVISSKFILVEICINVNQAKKRISKFYLKENKHLKVVDVLLF